MHSLQEIEITRYYIISRFSKCSVLLFDVKLPIFCHPDRIVANNRRTLNLQNCRGSDNFGEIILGCLAIALFFLISHNMQISQASR